MIVFKRQAIFLVLRSTTNTLLASPLKFGHFYRELHNRNRGIFMALINAALNLLCLNSVSLDFSFSICARRCSKQTKRLSQLQNIHLKMVTLTFFVT